MRTIRAALSAATEPGLLRFGVVNQTLHPKSDQALLKGLPVRLVQVHPRESLGVCWARSICQTLYDGEPYVLQIDSHTVFAKGWDTYLRGAMESLPDKSVLSTYPYGFHWEAGKPVLDCEVSLETTLVLRPMPDQAFSAESPILRFEAKHLFERRFVPAAHLSAGFLFAHGRFVEDIPYDPQLYFHGEEQNLTLRAYTHGWHLFHPPYIPLYHLYKQPGTDHKSHHWHPSWKRPKGQTDYLESRAKRRFQQLLSGEPMGVYGLGTARTLDDYAAQHGIDYRRFTIAEPAELAGKLR